MWTKLTRFFPLAALAEPRNSPSSCRNSDRCRKDEGTQAEDFLPGNFLIRLWHGFRQPVRNWKQRLEKLFLLIYILVFYLVHIYSYFCINQLDTRWALCYCGSTIRAVPPTNARDVFAPPLASLEPSARALVDETAFLLLDLNTHAAGRAGDNALSGID